MCDISDSGVSNPKIMIWISHRASCSQISETNYYFSGKSLQQKWKNIRTSFSRELKRRSGAKSGAAASRKSSYVYFPQLQFLEETVQNNQTQTSIDETEVVSNHEGGDVQIRPPVAKKKKKSDDDSLIEIFKESVSLRENR